MLAMYIVYLHCVRLINFTLALCVPVYTDHCSTCLRSPAQKYSLGVRLYSAVDLAAGISSDKRDPVQQLLRRLVENHPSLNSVRGTDDVCEQSVNDLHAVCSDALELFRRNLKHGFNIVFFVDDWNSVDKVNTARDPQNSVQQY